MKIKNFFNAFILSLAVFSASNISFANQVEDANKISIEPKLGSKDMITTLTIKATNADPNSPVMKNAEKYGYYTSNITQSSNSLISNKALENYINKSIQPFLIILSVVLIIIIFAFLKGDKEKVKDYTVSTLLHSIAFFGTLGGVNSAIGGFVLGILISITASSSAVGFGTVKSYVNDSAVNDIEQYYSYPEGDNEFINITDIGIAEKRTLQYKVALLHSKSEFKNFTVSEYAEYFKEVEDLKAFESESLIVGSLKGYSLQAPVKNTPFLSFSKDKFNHPAVVADFKFASDPYQKGDMFNTSGDYRISSVKEVMSSSSFDTFGSFNNLFTSYKTAFDNGSVDISKTIKDDLTSVYAEEILGTLDSINNESSTSNELVDNAEFLTNFIGAKLKGLDNEKTALKIYNMGQDIYLNALHIQCLENDEKRKSSVQNFNKFINSNKNILDAVIDSNVNFECIIPKDGTFIYLGFNESTDADKIKEANNSLKAFKEAGTTLYKIIDNAKLIALSNYISKNYDAIEKIKFYEDFGLGGLFSTLDAVSGAGYAAFKVSSASRADISISNYNMNPDLYVYEDAVFGIEEDDLNNVSENDRKAVNSHFHNLKTASYYNGKNVLKKFNIDDFKLAQQSSKSTGSQKLVDEMLSALMLGLDNNFKYAASLPQNLTIREGLEFCKVSGNCDSIYQPSIYEVQVNSGKQLALTGFYCLIGVNTIKVASSTLDISGTQGLVGKATTAVKGVAKGIKAVLAGAEVIASTYETPCTLALISGLTMGYILPVFQQAAGNISLMLIVYPIMFLLTVGPVVVMISFLLLNFGSKDIIKEYFMRILGYLVQVYLFVPIVLLIMFFYSQSAYQLIRMLLANGFSTSSNLITMCATMIVIVVVIITLASKIFEFLQTAQNTIASVMKLNSRFDTSAESKFIQGASATVIAKELTSNGNLTFNRVADLLGKNKDIIDTAQANNKNFANMAKKAFENKTPAELEVLMKDPAVKKLYDFHKGNENKE